MPPFIVSVRFQPVGKLYHFDATAFPDLVPGDRVIVETSRGTQLGEVIQTFTTPPPPPPDGEWKPIERRATPRELVMRQLWQKKELEATINARAAAAEMKLKGVKIIASEFSYDGSRLAILFSTETDEKLDLRDLRSVLQRGYTRSKVEMRQIGPRDVAKLIGGMGACGIAQRCCSKFLTDFSPVSIKMAKEQGISLTPSEITGMCGRLRCCLIYEYEQYVQARKTLPKRNKRVITPRGEGKVIDTYPLRDIVVVLLDHGERDDRPERAEFHKDELQPWDELEALRRKAEAPCDRHENGECDCGKATAAPKPSPQLVDDFEIDDEENAGNAAVLEAIAALESSAAPKTGGSPKDKPRGGLRVAALPKERGNPPESAAPPSAPASEPTGKPKPKKRGKPRRGGIPKAAASPQTPSPIQPSPAQTAQKAVSKKRRGKRGKPRNDGNPNPSGGAAG